MRAAIIGALLALLGGCGALRVAYGTGPLVAWWWLDGYLDFPSEQVQPVKSAIDRWFDWHRRTQLPDYAAQLAALQALANGPVTSAQLCDLNVRLRQKLAPALDQALVLGAEFVPTLTKSQLGHLEKRYAKNLEQMREEFLQPDPTDRAAATLERAIKRAEQVYGTLDVAQRRVIADGVAASPFDPQAWYEERRRRQADTVATLRRLVAERADRDQALAALRTLAERNERSPEPTYRDYQRRLTDYNCAFVARIHNAATPAQLQAARDTLRGWEEDLRTLAAPNGP